MSGSGKGEGEVKPKPTLVRLTQNGNTRQAVKLFFHNEIIGNIVERSECGKEVRVFLNDELRNVF
jgi:hypothetical protein